MSRKTYDFVMKGFTYLATSFSALILLSILIFTFSSGAGLLSWQLVTGDYYSDIYAVTVEHTETEEMCNCEYEGVLPSDTYYSEVWGVALTDALNKEGEDVVEVSFIHEDSPLNGAENIDGPGHRNDILNSYLRNTIETDIGFGFVKDGSEAIKDHLELSTEIKSLALATDGGGIWGSVVTTLMLIVVTLLIAVPFGVLTAIYMNEYSNKNKFVKILGTMIDALTGVPSVIFGLLGAGIFVPMVSNMTGGKGQLGSVLAGCLTLSVILLPVIVKTTRQALNQVPMDLRRASFALGANKTQTTFKVVLGNSIPGIISGIILGIGRIVGESAAIILTVGTLISDNPDLFDRSTSLAVHIWSVMRGSNPNFELASAIALIILMVVLMLNITVKTISRRFDKMRRI